MPLFTAVAVILGKKILLKGGLSIASNVLKEVATNPVLIHQLGKAAEDLGLDATRDSIELIVEGVKNATEHIGNFHDLIN
jgi:hypothetical protein